MIPLRVTTPAFFIVVAMALPACGGDLRGATNATPIPDAATTPSPDAAATPVTDAAPSALHDAAPEAAIPPSPDTGPSGVRAPRIPEVATGAETCVLTTKGLVECWDGDETEHADSDSKGPYLTPEIEPGLPAEVVAIAGNGDLVCALSAPGDVTCWGNLNAFPEGATAGGGKFFVPTAVTGLGVGVRAVVAGEEYACALTQAGGVKCWGSNVRGNLGAGQTAGSYTPVDVVGLTSGVASIATSGQTCAVLTTGEVRCWGSNYGGVLGDGTTTDRNAPVAVVGLTGVTRVATGDSVTCAILAQGDVDCWGINADGELGDGTTNDSLTPVAVRGLASRVTSMAAGDAHVCALLDTGVVECWGDDSAGQLGDGTNTSRSVPQPVTGLPRPAVRLVANYDVTYAVLDDDSVWYWGTSIDGAPSHTPPSAVPVRVTGL